MRAAGLPSGLARGGERVLRPRDAGIVYAQPWTEFKRLAERGILKKIATGYYAIVPVRRVSDGRWMPALEAAALGIARADYGPEAIALMGISAARHHGAIPREVGTAVVAVPKQRPALRTSLGRVAFVKRDVSRLDVQRMETELGAGWVTTVEQTLVDLAARPSLGGLAEADVTAAMRALSGRADWELVERLAKEQHRPGALASARVATGAGDA